MAVNMLETSKRKRWVRTVALIGALAATTLFNTASPAQTDEAAPSERAPLSGRDLERALSQSRPGSPVTGAVISGRELRTVIETGRFDIHIDNSLIQGGLNFERLSNVTVAIRITNSDIAAEAITRRVSAGMSVFARRTRFEKRLDFSGSRFLGPVAFGRAHFVKPADFPKATFTKSATFRGSQFEQGVSFRQATAMNRMDFLGANFNDRAGFNETTFAEVSFDKAAFVRTANFGKTVFQDEASFSGTVFSGRARFDSAHFAQSQIFEAQFDSLVTFVGTRFDGNVEFRPGNGPGSPQFLGGANFFDTRIEGYAVFNGLVVPGDLSILSSTIVGGLQVANATFDGALIVTDSRLQGPSNFDLSEFRSITRFFRSHFLAETIIQGATFRSSAVFQDACFADRLALAASDLGPYVDFRGASIGHLDLRSIREPKVYTSRFDLRGANIAKASFEDAIFTNHLDLSDARIGVPSVQCGDHDERRQEKPGLALRFVTFEDAVSAQRTAFAGRMVMFGAKFEQGVDFTNAAFPRLGGNSDARFSLSFVDFGDIRLRWHQLPDPRLWTTVRDAKDVDASPDAPQPTRVEPVSRTLAGLEGIFRSRGQLADVNNTTYHRKIIELREARAGGWTPDRIEKELEWLVWGVTCGYGTKIWWIVGWALLLNLFFTLVYWRWADIDRKPHPDLERDFSLRLRLLDLPQHYQASKNSGSAKPAETRKLVNALRVSSVVLFKVGYRDTTVSGRIGRVDLKAVVRLEWFLGFLVLAAFTVTLSNTQPLINRLISGVL